MPGYARILGRVESARLYRGEETRTSGGEVPYVVHPPSLLSLHLVERMNEEGAAAGHFGYDCDVFRVYGAEIAVVGASRHLKAFVAVVSFKRCAIHVAKLGRANETRHDAKNEPEPCV